MGLARASAWVGLFILPLIAPAVAGASPTAVASPEAICAAEIPRYEQLYGIPSRLLHSISIVESGRWDSARKTNVAWPWTVATGGEGKYFDTKAEAVAEVKRLKAKGVRNIDVGCMQVNLQHHPNAFSSIEEALDPGANVAYAGRFLKGLYGATNHWPTAASYYHSQTPSLATAYREKLMKVWNGPGAGTAVASVSPVPRSPSLRPRPSSSAQVDEMRDRQREKNEAMRDEAKRIADAYRQARLAEYQLRRVRMIENRRSGSSR